MKSTSFCIAPWVHAHVASGGKRRLCCIASEAPPEYSQMSWTEFKNSDYMKNIRKAMLNGESVPDCSACDVPNRVVTGRTQLNFAYQHLIDEMISRTQPDGHTDMETYYVDYRSSLCNLQCRTCTPMSSSSYHNFLLKQDPQKTNELFYLDRKNTPPVVFKHYNEKLIPEFFEFINSKKLNRIYFAGGEPLVEPNHFTLLEKIIELKQNQNIELYYNTNFMVPEKRLADWITLINQFKRAHVFVSIDGTNEINDYIRVGSDFKKIKRNLDILSQNLQAPHRAFLDITLTSLNLFFLKDMAEFSIQQNMRIVSKLMIDGMEYNPMLRAEVIPEIYKKKIVSNWRHYFDQLDEHKKTLLEQLNQTIYLFEEKPIFNLANTDYMLRLNKLESFYPDKNKLKDLLKLSDLGREWSIEFEHATS